MNIEWEKIVSEGLQGDLAKGVSAAFATLVDNQLIVAGGANFPDKLGFEGGSKALYDEILLYDKIDQAWKVVGELPQPMAYGVSVSIPGGALWLGGTSSTESQKTTFKVSFNENDPASALSPITLEPFVPLPATMDNFAGCIINETVFVAGGNVNGKPSNTIYSIHINNDSSWTALPPFPGLPRVQPVIAAIEEEGESYIYLLGGFFGGDGENEPAMATDVLRYETKNQKWEKVGQLIDPETKAPFSLGGATAMPMDNRYILCLGGVNHDIFLDAITTQYTIGHDRTLTEEERSRQNHEFSANYMTQPIEYYKFNSECRIFDTQTGTWSTIDNNPNTARAGATLVWDGLTFYAVQGELKPGVRSPETWRGTISIP